MKQFRRCKINCNLYVWYRGSKHHKNGRGNLAEISCKYRDTIEPAVLQEEIVPKAKGVLIEGGCIY